jgi:Cell division protein CrgA
MVLAPPPRRRPVPLLDSPTMARPASARREERSYAGADAPNPVWFKPVMFGFMLIGLVWIVVYYISGQFPIPGLGSWNILIGFAIAFVGFLMTLRWR